MMLDNALRKQFRVSTVRKTFRNWHATACCCVLLSVSGVSAASTTYGIFDARTMAMGGTSVASANNDNAQFYNSALLAFNDEIEERTQDARFWFPIIAPQLGDATIDVESVHGDDQIADISRSVSAFNTTPDAVTAQAVVNSTARFNESLSSVANEELFADIYVGMALSEPGRFQGAGFFLGTRLLGSGSASVTDTDLTALQAYQEGLTFVASGGAQGVAHPEIFDANGALIDPSNDFDSSVDAAGVALIEVGVAMSAQFEMFGESFAAGWSYKAIEVDTFEDTEQFVDQRIDVDQNSKQRASLNFDVGLAKDLAGGWRIGLAVKDIIPHDYRTSLNTKIKLRPRPRLGVAYQQGNIQLAVDVDLIENQPLASERAAQEASFGTEWTILRWLRLRGGYRHDFQGRRGGSASVGIGTRWKRLAFDAAYAKGDSAEAVALQVGIAF